MIGMLSESMMDLEPAPASQYWAAEADLDALAGSLVEKVEEYYKHLDATGRLLLWRKAAGTYFGADPSGGWSSAAAVTYGGEQGELVLLRQNDFGNLVDHIVSLTTSSRLAAQARALGTGPEAAAQVSLAEALIEYRLSLGLEREGVKQVRYACLFGEGWMYSGWDVDRVRPDISQHALTPLDIIRDPKRTTEVLDWVIIRHRRNRWDMMALYPEFEQQIRDASPFMANRDGSLWDLDISADWKRGDEDEISVYEFVHLPTPAMPQGRHSLFIPDAVLRDGPNLYEKLPANNLRPISELYNPFGFSRNWDLLALTEALDSVVSAMVTNHDAFAVPPIWAESGSDLDVDDIQGLKFVRTASKPEAINLLSMSPESLGLAEYLIRAHERLSGVNAVARGDVPAQLRSGAALAMVHSVALQYNNALQQAYAQAMEETFTDIVTLYQKFGSEENLIEQVGADQRGYISEFKADALSLVRRIAIDLGSPLMRTTAGRRDIADTLLQNGMIPTPQSYVGFIQSGKLEDLHNPERDTAILIKRENELLRSGQPTKVLITDMHEAHVREHMAELATPDVRMNDEVAGVILAHIQEHAALALAMPPDLAVLTGQPNILQLQQLMMGPGAAPGQPPPPEGQGGPNPNGSQPKAPGAERPTGIPESVQMPALPGEEAPYDPGTGQGGPVDG